MSHRWEVRHLQLGIYSRADGLLPSVQACMFTCHLEIWVLVVLWYQRKRKGFNTPSLCFPHKVNQHTIVGKLTIKPGSLWAHKGSSWLSNIILYFPDFLQISLTGRNNNFQRVRACEKKYKDFQPEISLPHTCCLCFIVIILHRCSHIKMIHRKAFHCWMFPRATVQQIWLDTFH